MFRLLKLKPPHGWNAVAWELAIVTLGVLIALGAQQVATSLNDRQNAAAAMHNIRQELAYNLGFIDQRLRVAPCLGRRLDQIADYLDGVEAGASGPVPRFIGHPPYPELTDHRLEAARSAGWLSHVSADDQALIAAAYQPLMELRREFDNEQVAWAELRLLADRPRLSPTEIANVRTALQHARLYFFVTGSDSRLALRAARQFGVRPSNNTPFRPSSATCLPMSTSFEEAVRRNGSTFSETR